MRSLALFGRAPYPWLVLEICSLYNVEDHAPSPYNIFVISIITV